MSAIVLLQKIRTTFDLGLLNICRVVIYRVGIKLGVNPVLRLHADVPAAPFFMRVKQNELKVSFNSGWQSSALLFSFWHYPITEQPPDWFTNPFNGQRVASPESNWWQIPDFDPSVGDIKLIGNSPEWIGCWLLRSVLSRVTVQLWSG